MIHKELVTLKSGKQVEEFGSIQNYYSKDIYKPKLLTPRAKDFRDRFFIIVDEMRSKYDYDEFFDCDYYIKQLEEMKPDIDYLCVI